MLSCDKSTIELGKQPNLEQSEKSSSTKLWSFPNSTSRFSNLSYRYNRNVLSCDKSTIESGKHRNLEHL
jgi:hypothetical protein